MAVFDDRYLLHLHAWLPPLFTCTRTLAAHALAKLTAGDLFHAEHAPGAQVLRAQLAECRQELTLERTAAAEQRTALHAAVDELNAAKKAERVARESSAGRGLAEEREKQAVAQVLAAEAELKRVRGDASSAAATQQAAAEAELEKHLKEQRVSHERQMAALKADYKDQINQLQIEIDALRRSVRILDDGGDPKRSFQAPNQPKARPPGYHTAMRAQALAIKLQAQGFVETSHRTSPASTS